MKELICINCPRGCHLHVDDDLNVTGNFCPRGAKYAKDEMTHPVRMVTSTVALESKTLRRLPVITEFEVDKNKMFDVIEALRQVKIKAPVHAHDVVLRDVAGTGVNVVATKTILE